jgi:hypothetical protein
VVRTTESSQRELGRTRDTVGMVVDDGGKAGDPVEFPQERVARLPDVTVRVDAAQ